MITYIIIGIVIVLILVLLAFSYVKAPPDVAYVISGLSKQPRILIGKAGFRIPFLERIDKLILELIQIDIRTEGVANVEFININADAVANVRISKDENLIRVAAQHFLNLPSAHIASIAQQVLEGNMREIIGTMELKSLVNNKVEFSQKVQQNVKDDMANMGLEIVNLNVQDFTDDNGAIKDLGIDNLVKIQKSARIARAESEKEIKIKEALADEQGAKARALADANIAEQQKELELKKAQFKIEQDTKKAEADVAYEIQKQEQQKTVNEKAVDAEVAKAERMAELKEKEVKLKEKELDALVRKQADADRYAVEQKAEADKQVTIFKAEAQKAEAERMAEAKIAKAKADKEAAELEAKGIQAKLEAEAVGKKAILLAEAEGIRQRGLAEAEAIEKKAEAQAKMKEASIVEMAMNALPEIAKEVSAPMANIKDITMYGDQSTQFIENNTQKVSKVVDVARDALGLDVKALISAFLGGKAASDKSTQSDEKE